jgi:hypothetical protein
MAVQDNRTPPVSFLVTAWASTSHHLSEQVRVTGKSPREIMENTGGWEHRWKWTPTQDNQRDAAAPTSSASSPSDSSLIEKMAQMKEQIRVLQSQRDRSFNVDDVTERPFKKHKANKGNKGGKGGKKGKGFGKR